MIHSFDTEIAKRWGIDTAVIIHCLAFWIKKNQANERHNYEGYTWTYNTGAALAELFPYWDTQQVYRRLKKMEQEGLIKSGNFNSAKFDRTKWYAIVDESILQTYELHLSKVKNGIIKSETPIPVSNQLLEKDTKVSKKKTASDVEIPESLCHGKFEGLWMDFIDFRKEIKKTLTVIGAQRIMNKLGQHHVSVACMALDKAITSGWTGVFPESIPVDGNGIAVIGNKSPFQIRQEKQEQQEMDKLLSDVVLPGDLKQDTSHLPNLEELNEMNATGKTLEQIRAEKG